MAKLPAAVVESHGTRYLPTVGFELLSQGKARNIYSVPDHNQLLLMEATDRISIFDIVLPTRIPHKGEVLTALSYFWFTGPLKHIPNHLIGETNFPHSAVLKLREKFPILPAERCLLVRKFEVQSFELIFRHHLGGSVYRDYEATGTVSGFKLSPGLRKWAKLPEPIFTPSTKEKDGHDVNIEVETYLEKVGRDKGLWTISLLKQAYKKAYAYAAERGVLILDTKMEVDITGSILLDEVLTPDSSRFTTVEDFGQAIREGRDPVFYDKQVVRDWGIGVSTPWGIGIHRLNPKDPDHLAFVETLQIPQEVVANTSRRYLDIFQWITGMTLFVHQRVSMGID